MSEPGAPTVGSAAGDGNTSERRIAIACQGGGSHTAFTAGVLARLLTAPELADRRVVGISGTSGGAICALLAWTALRDGEPGRAAKLLEGFWADNAASDPVDVLLNAWAVWGSTMQSLGMLPLVSPYDLPVDGLGRFRELLERWVDFGTCDPDPDPAAPMLVVGAVDVLSGRFRAFTSRHDRIGPDVVLASAAIPTLFPAVHGSDGGVYWDGLFSQNPPVRELLESRPDEVWVVQINPTAVDREPRTVLEIADRRNELAGNLSLYQELHFIERIDQLLASGAIDPGSGYRQIAVRILELDRSGSSRRLGPASKINRDAAFIAELVAQGKRQAGEFLAALRFEERWRAGDVEGVRGLLDGNATLTSSAPFPTADRLRGEELVGFLRDLRDRRVTLDLTRKQLARDRVTWTVRRGGGRPSGVLGRIEAHFRGGSVAGLRLRAGDDDADGGRASASSLGEPGLAEP